MTYIPRSSNGKIGTSSSIPKVAKKKRTFRIFRFLGTLMIVAIVVGFAGLSFFKVVSEAQLEEAKTRLSEASKSIDDRAAKIDEIRIYDNQLKTADMLLDNHIAPSLLFDDIELNTAKTTQYKTFGYKYDPGFDAILTLGGGTKEFISVVAQQDELKSKDSPFEVFVLNGVTKQTQGPEDGNNDSVSLPESDEVVFDVTGILKKSRFVYSGSRASETEISTTSESENIEDESSVEDTQSDIGDSGPQPDVSNEDNL